jgi:hypothetical protein
MMERMIPRWKDCIETRKIIIQSVKIIARWKDGMQDGKNDEMKGKDMIERIISRHKG